MELNTETASFDGDLTTEEFQGSWFMVLQSDHCQIINVRGMKKMPSGQWMPIKI
jgi:hypothetical protein